MKLSLTIRNADVILPGGIQRVDVSVVNGLIHSIGRDIPDVGEVIDADGLFLVTRDLDLIRGQKNVVLTPNIIEFKRLCKENGLCYKLLLEQYNNRDAFQKIQLYFQHLLVLIF